MVATEIAISVNRKSDIEVVQQKIISHNIQFPVYIREYETLYQIDFTSDYEEWELDTEILGCFPDYEFTTDLEKGRKEIRIQIHRYQSELSSDGWGRQIENPLNETKYLVRKSTAKSEKFNPRITVLFEGEEQRYYVNIVNGINTETEEKGFLLLDNFKSADRGEDTKILGNRLYRSSLDAFHDGYNKLGEMVDADFIKYLEDKKRETREIEKLPRKIVRDFITACNKSDVDGMVKNMDEHISYERRLNWKTLLSADGKKEFLDYLVSPEQNLMGKDFKIRSSWSINLPNLNIGVKYLPPSVDKTKQFNLKYGEIKFVLKDNKIVQIIDES